MSLAGRKIRSISTSRSWTWSNCLGDVTDEIPWNSIPWVWNHLKPDKFPIWIDRSWDKFPSPIFLINPSQSHSHIVLACIGYIYIYTILYTCRQITYIYIYIRQMPGFCPDPQWRRATHHHHQHHHHQHHVHQHNNNHHHQHHQPLLDDLQWM